jgi:twitching motility protein PilU
MSAMQRLFQLMAEKKASVIFMSSGAPINIKINGVAIPINQHVMDGHNVEALLYEVLTDKQKKEYEDTLELNAGYAMPGIGSFRISAFRQKGSQAVVVRYIPLDVPNIDGLGVPEVLKEVIMEKRGLILMVGAAGSGKSTTLASMLDYRNERKSGHVLTIEDPIEFIFKNKKCIVNQREVGTDTRDFNIALKNALRQAPDCIMIAEVRDKETMTAAIQYAQSGHICLATLHANNSYHALNRIISFYPLENRAALLEDLSATLRCIISQRLIRNKQGQQNAAVEVLLSSRHISELIGMGEINEIKEAMEKSLSPGSQTFEQCLFRMILDGMISQDEALANADSATNLLWMINNTEAGAAIKDAQARAGARQPVAKPESKLISDGGASFTGFNLDTGEVEAHR